LAANHFQAIVSSITMFDSTVAQNYIQSQLPK